ncbi:NAD(P)-binding domain-containing protein [Planomonospora sp. ID91781]|uniref:NAD(P)-binding domain-containing protein n=1 Tax=Planomonospora sp. ID91781 TaxID=2738135 RepID=UPI0018C3E5C7|nr:NAD(P)-binding domain-containing protein [Planomonospora sp. ID91781]MBG0824061.1 NAD(P)-binding domain-containing protein [Planomonospora sp. ID91781]
MIAFLGLGRMGAPMARRLVEAGHEVTVWNRTPRTVEGAAVAASPAEAVAGSDLVVTVLRDPAAVMRVLADAAPGLRAGAVVVEMSTIGPAAVAELRDRLPAQVGLVDAPVLGGVGPARDGTLTVLAGGRSEDLARCREVLGVFGTVREAGGPGAGAALKLAVMSALVPAQVLLAETVAYGEAIGVQAGTLLDVLGGTPLGALAERVRPAVQGRPGERRYGLDLAAKDLALAAHPLQTLAAAAADRLGGAVSAGLGDADLTAVFGHVAAGRRTGVRKIDPASVPATNGLYSHAARSGNLLFVSGQVALDHDGKVVGEGDMTRQAELVMEYLARVLADQGCTFDDVTHIRTFVTDMSLLPEYAAVRRRYITGAPPASTTVEVSRLFRPGLLIEVEVTAVVPAVS